MSKEMAFTVFCLESYKVHKNLSGKEVSLLFDRYGVFDYIREFYDVLHTTGHNYINNDLVFFICKMTYMPELYYSCCNYR